MQMWEDLRKRGGHASEKKSSRKKFKRMFMQIILINFHNT